jgi:hypothetical protein
MKEYGEYISLQAIGIHLSDYTCHNQQGHSSAPFFVRPFADGDQEKQNLP